MEENSGNKERGIVIVGSGTPAREALKYIGAHMKGDVTVIDSPPKHGKTGSLEELVMTLTPPPSFDELNVMKISTVKHVEFPESGQEKRRKRRKKTKKRYGRSKRR